MLSVRENVKQKRDNISGASANLQILKRHFYLQLKWIHFHSNYCVNVENSLDRE